MQRQTVFQMNSVSSLMQAGSLGETSLSFVFFYGLHLDLKQLALFKVFFFFPKSPALEISAFCIFRC